MNYKDHTCQQKGVFILFLFYRERYFKKQIPRQTKQRQKSRLTDVHNHLDRQLTTMEDPKQQSILTSIFFPYTAQPFCVWYTHHAILKANLGGVESIKEIKTVANVLSTTVQVQYHILWFRFYPMVFGVSVYEAIGGHKP